MVLDTLPENLHDESSDDNANDDGSFVGDDYGEKSSTSSQVGTDVHDSSSSTGFQLATNESKAVRYSKALVYVILAIFACLTGVMTWFYVRRDEKNTFEADFEVYATTLLDNANSRAKFIFDELHTVSTGYTSLSLDSNHTPIWPFFMLPHFDVRTDELGSLVSAQAILFAPIVPNTEEQQWGVMVEEHENEIMIDTFGEDPGFPVAFGPEIRAVPPEVYEDTHLDLKPSDSLLPVLQYGPKANSSELINLDMISHPVIQRAVTDSLHVRHAILSEVTDLNFLLGSTNTSIATTDSPSSIVVQPVFRDFNESEDDIVGFVFAVEPFEQFLKDLPVEVDGFFITVQDTCDNALTFVVKDGKVNYRGDADLHDSKYDNLAQRAEFAEFSRYDATADGQRHCDYFIVVYPSEEFEDGYHSSQPYLFAAVVLAVFLLTVSVFAMYDWMVRRRQKKVMASAQTTTAIIQSMFPKKVGERLIAEAEQRDGATKTEEKKKNPFLMRDFGVTKDIKDIDEEENELSSDPIAEFYTDTTIMFADIVGFTAWSSSREPKQVFRLLETIFSDFDTNANRRRVFKVETVGDCYVAVCGIPDPRSDHAVVMARFARDCMYRFQILTNQLEVTLGPDTADLALRVGLHSGQVTAGVLRGDRSRFQLFGDTMNTASRMESTSKPHRIQISQDTADILTNSNKSHWIRKREELVQAKGKGELQTYWLDVKGEGVRSTHSATSSGKGESSNGALHEPAVSSKKTALPNPVEHQKSERLVRWNVEILAKSLREVCVKRGTTTIPRQREVKLRELEQSVLAMNVNPILEVQDILYLIKAPPKTNKTSKSELSPDFKLDKVVLDQLDHFLHAAFAMYRGENAFHNFEHASHVTMSVAKLLSRIVAKDNQTDDTTIPDGIRADPIIQFACAFSAIIHDLDHAGVTNATLVSEQATIAVAYDNKSALEQNSFDLAWKLLMEDQYTDLRRSIYATEEEFKRFRELVITLLMATDVMDKDLGAKRKARWARAFSESAPTSGVNDHDGLELVNRRITIVLEHLIQASDVAHTMQHFQVYKKWNERLFQEMYQAYQQGRAGSKDPVTFWYDGEIGFLTYYVIPLAKKLKDCGVFGVSSDEYLNYAQKNKNEWVARGKEIVEEFHENALEKFGAVVQPEAEKKKEEPPKAVEEAPPEQAPAVIAPKADVEGTTSPASSASSPPPSEAMSEEGEVESYHDEH